MAHEGWVGVLSIEIHLPCAASLKDKRSEVRRIKAGVARRWSVSISEVGQHDKWQRAQLAVALASPDLEGANAVLGSINDWFCGDPEIEVIAAGSWVAPSSGADGVDTIQRSVG